MRHKRYYATQYTDEKRFYSQREANRADEVARQKQEDEEKKARRRKNVARQRREAEEKRRNSPEAVAAREAAAEARAAHEAEVRGVAAEREALGLTPKEYYARFITPLIDSMAERMSGTDAIKKAAYLDGAAYLLGTRDAENADAVREAVQKNLWQGDQKFIGELGYYIGTHKNNLEARYVLAQSIMPHVNAAVERVVAEGLYAKQDSARAVLGFKGWLSTPYISNDYEERNRLERRFHSGDTVKPWDLATVKEMAAKVEADPAAFEEGLYKGLKEAAQYVQDANRVLDIRREEVNAALEKGWFASPDNAQSANSAIGAKPEIATVHEAAVRLLKTSIGFDGAVQRDDAANDIVRQTLAAPQTYRTALQTGLAEENAKIFKVVDFAAAYTKAATVVADKESAKESVAQSIADIGDQGAFKRLVSTFKTAALYAESKSLDREIALAQATTGVFKVHFNDARSSAYRYVGSHATPEQVTDLAQKIVRAAPEPTV